MWSGLEIYETQTLKNKHNDLLMALNQLESLISCWFEFQYLVFCDMEQGETPTVS